MHKKTQEQIKQKTMLMSVIAVALVVLGVIVVTQSESLQGWLNLRKAANVASYKFNAPIYKTYGGKFVTPVASPVTSVVASTVVSPAGPSLVASAVTSPVASAVPVPADYAATLNGTSVPMLTGDVLKAAAKLDYVSNRAKYTLANSEKKRIIDMYKSRNPNLLKLRTK